MSLGDRVGARVQRTDRMLVTHDVAHFWAIVIIDLVMFLAAVLAWVFTRGLGPGRLAFTLTMLVGLQLGRTGFMTVRRASAYRHGWLRGRSAMVNSMDEASRRGMSVDEWLQTELARDCMVLGVDLADIRRSDEI